MPSSEHEKAEARRKFHSLFEPPLPKRQKSLEEIAMEIFGRVPISALAQQLRNMEPAIQEMQRVHTQFQNSPMIKGALHEAERFSRSSAGQTLMRIAKQHHEALTK